MAVDVRFLLVACRNKNAPSSVQPKVTNIARMTGRCLSLIGTSLASVGFFKSWSQTAAVDDRTGNSGAQSGEAKRAKASRVRRPLRGRSVSVVASRSEPVARTDISEPSNVLHLQQTPLLLAPGPAAQGEQARFEANAKRNVAGASFP